MTELVTLMVSVHTFVVCLCGPGLPQPSITFLADSYGYRGSIVHEVGGWETWNVPGVVCGVTFAGRWVWGGAE